MTVAKYGSLFTTSMSVEWITLQPLLCSSFECVVLSTWSRFQIFVCKVLQDLWKVHLVGYNSVADNTGIRLAVIASETWEMSRNSERIW